MNVEVDGWKGGGGGMEGEHWILVAGVGRLQGGNLPHAHGVLMQSKERAYERKSHILRAPNRREFDGGVYAERY